LLPGCISSRSSGRLILLAQLLPPCLPLLLLLLLCVSTRAPWLQPLLGQTQVIWVLLLLAPCRLLLVVVLLLLLVVLLVVLLPALHHNLPPAQERLEQLLVRPEPCGSRPLEQHNLAPRPEGPLQQPLPHVRCCQLLLLDRLQQLQLRRMLQLRLLTHEGRTCCCCRKPRAKALAQDGCCAVLLGRCCLYCLPLLLVLLLLPCPPCIHVSLCCHKHDSSSRRSAGLLPCGCCRALALRLVSFRCCRL
jgi:hypothetical protein